MRESRLMLPTSAHSRSRRAALFCGAVHALQQIGGRQRNLPDRVHCRRMHVVPEVSTEALLRERAETSESA